MGECGTGLLKRGGTGLRGAGRSLLGRGYGLSGTRRGDTRLSGARRGDTRLSGSGLLRRGGTGLRGAGRGLLRRGGPRGSGTRLRGTGLLGRGTRLRGAEGGGTRLL
ncbi:hypothetical protein BHS05_05835 [Myxococcus xanthus]|uniref:Uncharacterized protein n=1 Tax=Myxococcus xanthus TaxID=34 RepID=A0AAE6KQX7_MYXXA|nr:hypothetical protein BHS09_05820 [Myxococcus xanthus]QDE73834.1 hypothetical protein BHS08_05825 [Myxococcus xanthus]QDE95427.1 hypothetical protein BHS05_05835 [Myxococcus xanthus]